MKTGKKLTLIQFGGNAEKTTFERERDFQNKLNSLVGDNSGTQFAKPLRMLRDTIRDENIKELLVVFLTDGENFD